MNLAGSNLASSVRVRVQLLLRPWSILNLMLIEMNFLFLRSSHRDRSARRRVLVFSDWYEFKFKLRRKMIPSDNPWSLIVSRWASRMHSWRVISFARSSIASARFLLFDSACCNFGRIRRARAQNKPNQIWIQARHKTTLLKRNAIDRPNSQKRDSEPLVEKRIHSPNSNQRTFQLPDADTDADADDLCR